MAGLLRESPATVADLAMKENRFAEFEGSVGANVFLCYSYEASIVCLPPGYD